MLTKNMLFVARFVSSAGKTSNKKETVRGPQAPAAPADE